MEVLALASEREMTIGLVTKKARRNFFEGDFKRASICYAFTEALEGMTDEEYMASSICTDTECTCHN
jgi:hypothetical protein